MVQQLLHKELTEKIIGAAYEVYNLLGHGFAEKVYENALAFELKQMGLLAAQQNPISVYYKNVLVGEYCADLVVEGKVIVEQKAVANLDKLSEVQLVNYLKATGINVGLLINFGTEIRITRRVFESIKNPCPSA
jgi:GxxExxY protein